MDRMPSEIAHKIASTTFTLPKQFTELKAIGKGSYGVVISSLDKTMNRRVAIKKITPMAKHTVDAKHILREVRIMRYMGRHENIVSLEDLYVRETDDELYIIMELMDSDLHKVLQSKQVLSEAHFRHFLFQLLCGLKYLHDNRIIHRDLKPGNLLVTRDCKLRITDFGLARERPSGSGSDPDDEIIEPMTEHVVTRWYRPPELMLCPDGLYTYAVDLWSVGCIFAEMLGRKPLFPGKNFVDQLSLIFDVIGTPTRLQVSHIKNIQAKKFLDGQSGKDSLDFSQIYPQASDESTDLMSNLLLFEPSRRWSVDEALAAAFFTENDNDNAQSLYFPESDERCEFDFERNGSSKFQLKSLILQEAASLKKDSTCSTNRHVVDEGVQIQKEDVNNHRFASKQKEAPANDSSMIRPVTTTRRLNPGTAMMKNDDIAGLRKQSTYNDGAIKDTSKNGYHPSSSAKDVSGAFFKAAPRNTTRLNNQERGGNLQRMRPTSAGNRTVHRKPVVTGSGYGQIVSKVIKRPVSAHGASVNVVTAEDEAEKALTAARAWLSAAAAASDQDLPNPSSPQRLSNLTDDNTRAQRLDSNNYATKKAMGVLQSPNRRKDAKTSSSYQKSIPPRPPSASSVPGKGDLQRRVNTARKQNVATATSASKRSIGHPERVEPRSWI